MSPQLELQKKENLSLLSEKDAQAVGKTSLENVLEPDGMTGRDFLHSPLPEPALPMELPTRLQLVPARFDALLSLRQACGQTWQIPTTPLQVDEGICTWAMLDDG